MLYRFVKILMRTAVGMFYRHTLIKNMHHIPASGPALLVANHPSSLMDAALLGILLKRPVHFFARGDIFIHPLVNRILLALHMHPVHHHEAGRHTIGANDQSIDTAIRLLHKGEMVLFFPEGTSHVDYHLWTFKKGAFRIALQALAQNPALNLPVIPIGFNYSHPTKLFSTVWVQAGRPIPVNDYLADYRDQPATAIRSLTTRAFHAVKDIVVQTGKNDASTLFAALDIWRNSLAAAEMAPREKIETEMSVAATQPIWQQTIAPLLHQYHHALETAQTNDQVIAAASFPKLTKTPLVMGFPAAFIGWVLSALPLLAARWIADKKVTRIDFYSWILVASSAVLYTVWLLLLATTSFLLLPAWKAVTFLFITIATGQYCWNYFGFYQHWKLQQEAKKMPAATLRSLQAQRLSIINNILQSAIPDVIHHPGIQEGGSIP